jgi:hypothetical protein
MNTQKIQVKLFLEPQSTPPLQSFIPLFHRWISGHLLPGLLIDVANYAHVPHGPGVVLIGHEADYAIDEGEGRRGLLYSRKRSHSEPAPALRGAFRRVIQAALLLEQEPPEGGASLKIRTGEWVVRVNDRLAASNTEAGFQALRPGLDAFCGELFEGDSCALERLGDARQLLSVRITNQGTASLTALLDRLGGPVRADAGAHASEGP